MAQNDMKNSVTLEARGNIALVWIDNPPVNVLSHHVRKGLIDAIQAVEKNPEFEAGIILCRGRTFIAGADIKEFNQPAAPPRVTEIADAMEISKKLWLAALHGTTLGGGLEIALGCHYRFAEAAAKFGFPEVNLGLIPGAGGTVRLPRLVGYEQAVEMAAYGAPISAGAAVECGLIDSISESGIAKDALLDDAIAFAQEKLTQTRPTPCGMRENPALPSAEFWAAHQKKLERKRSQAPLVVLDVMQKAHKLDFAQAMTLERESFVKLRDSDQSTALRHVFFTERGALRVLKNVEGNIAAVGVVGGGLMGTGIAAATLLSGYSCRLIEQNPEMAEKAKAKIADLVQKSMARKKAGAEAETAAKKILANLKVATDITALSGCDLVIEAIYENMGAKQKLIQQLDATLDKATIIVSNTSYLDIDALSEGLTHRARFMGLHFFSPAHIMKLVEVVKAAKTDNNVFELVFNFCLKLGKMPVRAGVGEGFIGNRLLKIYRQRAEKLLAAGYLPAQIDAALRDFGMPLGPFELQDMTGLDIAWAMRKEARAAGRDEPAMLSDVLCEQNRLGKKSGGGWYDYIDGKQTASPIVTALVTEHCASEGAGEMQTTAPSLDDLHKKIFTPMYADAQDILKTGIAQSAEDIDLVMIHGYGFPRWRGGLMHFCKNAAPQA